MWQLAVSAVGASIGAITGGAGVWQRGKREREALEHSQGQAWQQYLYGKEYGDTLFNIQKTEALENLGIQKRNLHTQVGMATDEFNTGLLTQAFGIQDARVQMGSAIGAHLAMEGESGTRGNNTNDMIRAYATQGLDRNIEVQDRQNSDHLNRMVTGANMTSDAINREKASWMPGGYRVQEKDARDSYNLNMANLGQSDFDWRIAQAKPGFLDYFTGVMGGASAGLDFANKIINFNDAWNSLG